MRHSSGLAPAWLHADASLFTLDKSAKGEFERASASHLNELVLSLLETKKTAAKRTRLVHTCISEKKNGLGNELRYLAPLM